MTVKQLAEVWHCDKCKATTHRDHMVWIADRFDEPGHLECPCGSDDIGEAWECGECGDEFPEWEIDFEFDACKTCAGKHDTGNIEAAHRERLAGFDA